MPRKRYSTEQIVTKLRQAEVELGRGLRTPQVCKKLDISEQTYYRWRREYGGLRLDQAKRLKTLEQENVRLKKLVADQALDNAIVLIRLTPNGPLCSVADDGAADLPANAGGGSGTLCRRGGVSRLPRGVSVA